MAILKVPVTENDHIRGNFNAPITLLEYGDYECPYCGLVHPIIKRVQNYFGEQLRFVFRHFPLAEIHPHAEPAAETAEFAGTHKKFWEMHDSIYEHQDGLSINTLSKLAKTLGLQVNELRTVLGNRIYLPKIKNDFISGVRSGVNGTPTFFLNGYRHDGSYRFEDLVAVIKQIIR